MVPRVSAATAEPQTSCAADRGAGARAATRRRQRRPRGASIRAALFLAALCGAIGRTQLGFAPVGYRTSRGLQPCGPLFADRQRRLGWPSLVLRATPPGGRPPPPGQSGTEEVPDPVTLLQQMLRGEAAGRGPAAGGFPGMPGAGPGGAPVDPLAAMLGSGLGGGFGGLGGGLGGKKKQTTDSFITDRIRILQKVKRPVMVLFFAYCWHKGWVGQWGFFQGALGSSYLDMLAVPLRVLPRSPMVGCAFFQAQLLVDYAAKGTGFLINLARGKTKIPTFSDLQQKLQSMQPPLQQQPGAASPWGAQATAGYPFGANQASPWTAQPSSMPTAPTTPLQVPPLQGQPFQAPPPPPPEPKRPPPRNPPPVIDADVTFLD